MIQFKNRGWKYFRSVWNVGDQIVYILFVLVYRFYGTKPGSLDVPYNIADPDRINYTLNGTVMSIFMNETSNNTMIGSMNSTLGFTKKVVYDDTPTNEDIWIRIAISLLLVLFFLKIMFFVRINEEYGRLADLLLKVLQDLLPFQVFFFGCIIVYAGVFAVLYMKVDQNDYPSLPYWAAIAIQSFRNGVGDI